jgi:hypothetical protein
MNRMNPTAIREYTRAGLYLIPIPPIQNKPVKGPTTRGWNRPKTPDNPDGYSNDPQDIIRRTTQPWANVGLALGPSKVTSIDLDDLKTAREVLALADIDIDALLAAPDAVRIIGREGRAKLLYRVPESFECCTVTLTYGEKGKDERAIFELRYKGSNGHTAQDLLPPSWHPDTGKPYEWIGDITKIPPLPQALADLWKHWEEWKSLLQSLDPHQAEVINKAKKPKTEARAPQVEGIIDPITAFNERHTLHEVLTSHEYRRKGPRRYIRPGSTSGVPGVVLLDDEHIYSHGGDVLADGCKHDAFDVYRLLACGGDWRKAFEWDPQITRHNQKAWREAKGNGADKDPPVEAYTNDPEIRARDRESGSKGSEGAPSEGKKQEGEIKPSIPPGIDAATLWGMEHPDPKWAVPGFIPEGVTILAGRPKAKKSWLMLGTAVAVACGGVALGSIRVTQGDVLYLALEDAKRRLTQRLKDINPEEAPPAGRLTFYTEWPRLHLGGADRIKLWLGEHPQARLVVIDTLAKVRPPNSKAGNVYTDDYIVGETLTEISRLYGVAIVVVHHVRKLEADDPIDLISGSLGLTGSVDGYIVLRKEPGAADAFLYVNGRDIEEEGNYALEWHSPTCTWHLKEGEARIYKLSPERKRIIDLLTEHGPLGTKEVVELLNPGIEIKDPKTSREYRKGQFLLYKLRDDGYIQVRFYDKRWEVCG